MEPVISTPDKIYDKIDFNEAPLGQSDYENCQFNHCNLSNINLSDLKFIDCVFTDCNLSNAKMHKTSLQEVKVRGCKMLGLHFEQCNPFSLSFGFDNCILDHCSFYHLKIKKTVFNDCQIREADFNQTDLTEATFNNCDLHKTVFDGSTLEKADLRSSYHYSIDPERNRVKKAKFSLSGVAGLLDKFDIIIE
jgi:uncharacterized protein YjbI with pentapeptide repeats